MFYKLKGIWENKKNWTLIKTIKKIMSILTEQIFVLNLLKAICNFSWTNDILLRLVKITNQSLLKTCDTNYATTVWSRLHGTRESKFLGIRITEAPMYYIIK